MHLEGSELGARGDDGVEKVMEGFVGGCVDFGFPLSPEEGCDPS